MRSDHRQPSMMAGRAAWRLVTAVIVAALAVPAEGQSPTSDEPPATANTASESATPEAAAAGTASPETASPETASPEAAAAGTAAPETRASTTSEAAVSATATTEQTSASIQSPAKPPVVNVTPATDGVRPRSATAAAKTAAPEAPVPKLPPPVPTGFTVIVNATNPIDDLSRKSVDRLFLKRVKTWDPWDRSVEPVNLPLMSVARSLFSKDVHDKRPDSVHAYWRLMIFSGRGSPPKEMRNDLAVIAYVAKNPGAIGYVSNLATLPATVKPLDITD